MRRMPTYIECREGSSYLPYQHGDHPDKCYIKPESQPQSETQPTSPQGALLILKQTLLKLLSGSTKTK